MVGSALGPMPEIKQLHAEGGGEGGTEVTAADFPPVFFSISLYHLARCSQSREAH